MDTDNQEVTSFFRLLIDETRLKIIGVVAQRPASVDQLAKLLKIKPSLVSHHLDMLTEAALVRTRVVNGSHAYELQTDTLHELAKRHLAAGTPNIAVELDGDAYERKVLADFSDFTTTRPRFAARSWTTGGSSAKAASTGEWSVKTSRVSETLEVCIFPSLTVFASHPGRRRTP